MNTVPMARSRKKTAYPEGRVKRLDHPRPRLQEGMHLSPVPLSQTQLKHAFYFSTAETFIGLLCLVMGFIN